MKVLCGVCAALLLASLWAAPPAAADAVQVNATLDPGMPLTQARKQALDLAFVEAVQREAQRIAPPQPQARAAALRDHLAPNALTYIRSYHEIAPPRPAGEQANATAAVNAEATGQPGLSVQNLAAPAAPTSLDLSIEVNRAALRQILLRLGFLAGARHPGRFQLKLGPGVTEKDAKALEPLNLLMGLTRDRQPATPLSVTLERVPQGYYKAVLRNADDVQVADAPELSTAWERVWGQYFASAAMQPGPGLREVVVTGFSGVDAVQEFQRDLASWDDALQNVQLSGLDMDATGVRARFGVRVINQQRLDERLAAALPARSLALEPQEPALPLGTAQQ